MQCTQPLRLKSEAPGGLKVFKAVPENEPQKRMREIMTDNARELCMKDMKDMKDICEQESIKLHTSARYSPESNGVAERTIGVLTNAARAILHDYGLTWQRTYIIGRQRRHWAVVGSLRTFRIYIMCIRRVVRYR